METQRLPEGVELSYTDRAVHLTTNSALMAYLRQRDEAGTQVLLFSCHSREWAILEKAGIACHTLQLKTLPRRAANEREGNQNGNPTD